MIRLSDAAKCHYPKSFNQRSRALGELVTTLPSGDMIVMWPWGMACHSPREVEHVR